MFKEIIRKFASMKKTSLHITTLSRINRSTTSPEVRMLLV